MKLFAINETEWIAAETKEEAIEFTGNEGIEDSECAEIPESEWDEEIECEDPDRENQTIWVTIRALMADAAKRGLPCYIMTENN